MNEPTSKLIHLADAVVRKATRKNMGSNKQGGLLIEFSKGTMVVKIEIDSLNEPFLYSIGNLDLLDIDLSIKKSGERNISQPHLPTR